MGKNVLEMDANEYKGLILALAGMYPEQFSVGVTRLEKLQNSTAYSINTTNSRVVRTFTFPNGNDVVSDKADGDLKSNSEREFLKRTLEEMIGRIEANSSILKGDNVLEKLNSALLLRSSAYLGHTINDTKRLENMYEQKKTCEEFLLNNFANSNMTSGEMQALFYAYAITNTFNNGIPFGNFKEIKNFLRWSWNSFSKDRFDEPASKRYGKSFGPKYFDKDDLKERSKVLTMAVCAANLKMALHNDAAFDNSIAMEYAMGSKNGRTPKSARMLFLNREGEKSQIRKDKYKIYKNLIPQCYDKGLTSYKVGEGMFKLFGKERKCNNFKITDKVLAEKERRIFLSAMVEGESMIEKFREMIFEGMNVGSENLTFSNHDKILLASTLMNLYAIEGALTSIPQVDEKIKAIHTNLNVDEAYKQLPDCFDTIFDVLSKHPKLAKDFLKTNYESYNEEQSPNVGIIIISSQNDDNDDENDLDDDYGNDDYPDELGI